MPDDATPLDTDAMHRFIDRWRAGDRDAADDLIRRAGERLRRLATRMYRGFPNVRPLADPGDVVQDSWVRLLASLHALRPASTRDFFNLAAVHVRRELLDLARRAASRLLPTVSLHAGGDGSSAWLAVPDPAGRAPADFDLWVRFHEAVEELGPDRREIVGLVFYHGRSQREIAGWFGVDVRTVRRWWADACRDLRERVGADLPA